MVHTYTAIFSILNLKVEGIAVKSAVMCKVKKKTHRVRICLCSTQQYTQYTQTIAWKNCFDMQETAKHLNAKCIILW